MHHRWLSILVLAWALSLHPCRGAQLQRFDFSADAMGGAFSIALYSTDKSIARAASDEAFGELERLDRMLSNFRPASDWSRINGDAARHPVKVPGELFKLLVACVEYSRRSEGAFDISVGPLVRAWGFRGGRGRLAAECEVERALPNVGFVHIELDAVRQTVRFARPGMELDPGGIGKGYAVDRMVEILKRHGIERALVSAAGSSIFALGAPPGRPGWPVQIGRPETRNAVGAQVLLKDEALSTSGVQEKRFRSDGRTYGHILDPRTGYPPSGAVLAAVSAPRATDSEAWTKAVFVNGSRWSVAHTPGGWRVFFCDEENGCRWLR